MKLVDCSRDRHGGAILAILNDAIVHSTAVYDYEPRTVESMDGWFQTKSAHDFPVIGVEDERDELLGFATYGEFRARRAYKYSVEHSLYVRSDARGKGLGRLLLTKLIELAEQRGVHVSAGRVAGHEHAATVDVEARVELVDQRRHEAYVVDLETSGGVPAGGTAVVPASPIAVRIDGDEAVLVR